jgi:RND family efflux transporter MFP subunit
VSGRRLIVALPTAVLLWLPTVASAETVVGEGVIRSDERVTIRSSVPAPIRRLRVREGDVVRRGHLMLELENEAVRAQVEAALAEVRRVTAAIVETQGVLESATREYERNLKVPDLITARDLDLSRDAVRNARALLDTRGEELARAQQQVEVARGLLKETMVAAPFDGVVARVYLREGDTPKVAETSILDVISLEELYVEIALPLAYLGRLRAGMSARLDVEGETAALNVPARGTVRYVYPEVDPVIRMLRVKVAVQRTGERVLPGMFARVRIDVPPRGKTS